MSFFLQLHPVPGVWLPPTHNCYNFSSCYNFTYPASNCSLDGGWANALGRSPHWFLVFFSDFFYVFSNICWDVRWSQENSIEHNKELAAALRWTGDSNVAMSLDAVLRLQKRCLRYWLQDAILSTVTSSSLHSCVSRTLKRFGGVFERFWKFVYQVSSHHVCILWPCRFLNCVVDRSKAWAVVQGRGEARARYPDNPGSVDHHVASVDSLSGFASSCWIGSLRELDCPSNPQGGCRYLR